MATLRDMKSEKYDRALKSSTFRKSYSAGHARNIVDLPPSQ